MMFLLAEDGPGPDLLEAQERERGEKNHDEKTDDEPFRHGACRDGQLHVRGNEPAKQAREKPFKQKACGNADKCPEETENGYDQKIVGNNEPASGAHCLHDGDGALLFLQEGSKGALDADTRQKQGKDTDEIEEKKEIVEEPLHTGIRCPVSFHPFPIPYRYGPD